MKKSTKVIAVLMSLIMLLSSIPLIAFAVTENPYEQPVGSAEFAVSTSFCATGETTKIFIDISENSQMSAALFVLNYDTSLLKAINVETGLVLKNGYTSKNITESGIVKVSYADTNPNYDAGRLFEVEFEVIGDVPDDKLFVEVPITLSIEDLRNYEDYRIKPVVENGKITIINTHYGDVNISGDTTATDALMTLYSSSQLIEFTNEQKTVADVNGDGKVSAADALLILQYSAGEISNYPIFTIKKPDGLTVESKDETNIILCWNGVKNAIGYNLYMDGKKINEEPIAETTFKIENLSQDTTHEFSVSAVNMLMESDKSEIINVSTKKADRYVTFKDYDGTILNTQIVLSGENAVLPTVPTRTGYTFNGWDKETTNILVDTEFIAQYNINTYTVTFDYQYNSETDSDSTIYYTTVSEPPLISRTDYTLEGWYRDKNFVQKWNFSTDVIENNITLYAKWVTWGSWTTDTSLKDDPLYEVQSKTQYSYSDKSTKSSSSSSLSGWTKYDSAVTGYGSWSGWTTSYMSSNSSIDVQSATVYLWYCYKCRYCGAHDPWYTGGCSGCGADPFGDWYAVWNTNKWENYTVFSKRDYGTYRTKYVDSSNRYSRLYSEWGTAPTTGYRSRSKIYTYYYYKWSAYSDWSDTKYTSSSTRQVKTRTVYRYKLKQQ